MIEMFTPMIGTPGMPELLVILAIIILVFGAAKLPDLARGTGQALRIFKAETKGLRDGDDKADKSQTTAETGADKPIEGKIVDTPRDTTAG